MKKTRSQKSRDTVPLKGQFHEFFCIIFFHKSNSPKPMKITLASFRIFLKICGFASQGAPPVSTTPAANNGNNIRLLTS
jgi:hypothetical protein